jgi:hypothetical protein
VEVAGGFREADDDREPDAAGEHRDSGAGTAFARGTGLGILEANRLAALRPSDGEGRPGRQQQQARQQRDLEE